MQSQIVKVTGALKVLVDFVKGVVHAIRERRRQRKG